MGGGPWLAGADWLLPWRPAPCARAGGGASRDWLGRARRGSADGASVTRVSAPVSLPGRARGGGERAGAGAVAAAGAESPSGAGCTPQPWPRGRPAGTGSYPRGRRCRQLGSPDVSALRGGAADALPGPGRRLVLKGQRRVQPEGRRVLPLCTTPAPRGRRAPPPQAPSSRWAPWERRARPGVAADGCPEARFSCGRAVAGGAVRGREAPACDWPRPR